MAGLRLRSASGSYAALPTLATDAVQYVSSSASANDSNDGLSLGTAKRTVGAAIAALPTSGSVPVGRIEVGYGNFPETVTNQNWANVTIRGAGAALTTLSWATGGGAGVPAVTVGNNSQIRGLIEGLTITGPATNTIGAAKQNVGNGMSITHPAMLRNVRLTNWDSGCVLASVQGHTSFEDVSFDGTNYYGLYVTADGGDANFVACGFAGTVAGIACRQNSGDGGLNGATFLKCHFGFSPYGLYAETQTANCNWLIDVQFLNCSFEQVGNAALYTENQATNQSLVKDLWLWRSGFNWGASYKDAARPQNYAVVLGELQGTLDYDPGVVSPFTAGAVGIWYVGHQSSTTLRAHGGSSTADFTVASGRAVQLGRTSVVANAGRAQSPGVSGQWYPNPLIGTATRTLASTLGLLLAHPFYSGPTAITIDQLRVNVNAAGAAGANVVAGIYLSNDSTLPFATGATLLDTVTIDTTATGFRTGTFGSARIIPADTWFWVAGVALTAAATLNVGQNANGWSPLGGSFAVARNIAASMSGQTGLPASLNVGTLTNNDLGVEIHRSA